MSTRKLVIDGTTFIRSRDAARIVNLAPAYNAPDTRSPIVGRLIEKLWFVNVTSLKAFIADQERQREIWHAQLARKRREEQILAGHPSALLTV